MKKIKGRTAKEMARSAAFTIAEDFRRLSLRSKALIAAVIVLFICLCSLHSYSTKHFLLGTVINGADVSGMSLSQAKETIISQCDEYVLTLFESDGKTETIKGTEIGLSVTISKEFDNILKLRNGYTWIGAVMKNETADPGDTIAYTYDESMLKQKLSQLECVNVTSVKQPVDAELYYEDGEFLIRDAVIGNEVDEQHLEESVKKAIFTQQPSINLQTEGVYAMPEMLSDDQSLLLKKTTFDELKGISIMLKIGDSAEIIGPENAAGMYTLGEDGTMKLDEARVLGYVDSLANKYDTISSPKLFVTNSGETVEIENSYYGWQLDKDYALQTISECLTQKRSASFDLTDRSEEGDRWWVKTGVAYSELGYYGNTYAEVSIDRQYMWMYQNGEVVFESEVVTGLPDSEHDTPVGIYSIIYKEENATLRGEGYETEVAYWMVFTFDIGFHDADWQDAFGDDMYEYNGSHGCVNLPVDAAGELYELVYPGMPVFVY